MCAWNNIVSVLYPDKDNKHIQAVKCLKTTEYRFTNLSALFRHICDDIFGGVLFCHSFQCCNFVYIYPFSRYSNSMRLNRMSVILTWNAQSTNVCVCTWQFFETRLNSSLNKNIITFFLWFLSFYFNEPITFSTWTVSLISIYHNI